MDNKIKFVVELDADTGTIFIESAGGAACCEYEYNPNELRKSVMDAVSDWLHYYLGQ